MLSDGFSWEQIAAAMATLWLGLLQWLGVRHIKKLDAMDDKKANATDIERILEMMERHHEDSRNGRQEMYKKLDEHISEQHKVNLSLSKAVGRMDL